MEPDVLHAVLEELRGAILDRTLTKLESLGRFRVLARFAGFRKPILLSANPALPRLGWIEQLPLFEKPDRAPDALTGLLDGARLTTIVQEEGGAVVRFGFERGADHHRSPMLVAELIPRFANLILLGDEDKILWSLREFQGQGRAREVRTGIRYVAPAAARPMRRTSNPTAEASAEESANDAADRKYRPLEEEDARERLRAEIRRTLVRRRQKAATALHHIEQRMEQANEEPLLRRRAELLIANLSRVRRGMSSITVPDFDGERDIVIPLDPKLDGRGNSEELFRRARRLARGLDELEEQRKIQRGELERADRAIERFSSIRDDRDLLAFASDVIPGEAGAKRAPAKKTQSGKKAPPTPESALRRYILPGGWEVWVGRNAKQNDELTHRLASPRDLWFHARGAQGSHTVLRISSGKGEPPKAIVQAAAAIAAHHSKARNSKLVPVAYTEKRFVRKPRGAPVGTASMQREKVIFVEPKLPPGSAGD